MIDFPKKMWSALWSAKMALRSKRHAMGLGAAGPGCMIYPKVSIYNGRSVTLGSRVTLNDFVHIWGGGGVTIGDDSMVAAHCSIVSQSHDVEALSRGAKYRDTAVTAAVVIGRNVWIGTSAVILPGISIGDGAIVGAGAVVTRDVPARTLVVGVPARAVRVLGAKEPQSAAKISENG